MASKQSPFWNQDTIMAAGLAFAGMAVLQSKLFPAASWAERPLLQRLLESHLVAWWPVLLIAAGVGLWIAKLNAKRAHGSVKSVALVGGQSGPRKQNQN
jgi:hypothetical protein